MQSSSYLRLIPFPWTLNPILSILYNFLILLIIPLSPVSLYSSLLLLALLLEHVNKAKQSRRPPLSLYCIQYILLPVHLDRHTFWEMSTYMSLPLSPPQFCFCLLVAPLYIALTGVSNGPYVTKFCGYLSVLIFHDHPLLITLFFLKSSFYFALVASFVFPSAILAILFLLPYSLGFLSRAPSHISTLLRQGERWFVFCKTYYLYG